MTRPYVAMVSADWNECLAPCGPFDALVYHHPELKAPIEQIFRAYTGNTLSLGAATDQVASLLPGGIDRDQMDQYLDQAFDTYPGVPELIDWCHRHNILFMINTTGFIGYFQRVWAKRLLPRLPVLSAHPMIRYSSATGKTPQQPVQILELRDTADKPTHTAAVAAQWQIPHEKVIIMGDSGGDGQHFAWGAVQGACLIGCMTKPSLSSYCSQRGIAFTHSFGKTGATQRTYDYMDLTEIIDRVAR